MEGVVTTIAESPSVVRRFRPYPAYKGSGVEWLGQIPDHWDIARVSELTALINGYPFESE
jgi:type I restriction enzyme S subunit